MYHQLRAAVMLVLAVVLGTWTVSCTDSKPPVSPDAPRPVEVRLSAERAQAAAAKGALPHGRANVQWMAEVHTAAMQEVTAHRREWAALPHAARCGKIEGVIRSFVPQIAARTGVADKAFFEAAIAAARARIDCAGNGSLSLWGVPRRAFVYAQSEDVVTGVYTNYTGALEAAMSIDGTPDEMAAGLDRVLVTAAGINPADYEVLAGLAALGASSAHYWYEYEQAGGWSGDGGGGEGGGGDSSEPMAIFRRGRCGYWCRVGWSDLVGSVSGAASVVYGSGGTAVIAPGVVLAGAAIGGAAGSAAAAF
jgi:hypothetical protein